MDNIYKRLGTGFALASMAYLIAVMITKNIPINFASFFLWLVIDVALVVAMFRARKPDDTAWPWLMIAYTIGTGIVVLIATVALVRGESSFQWGAKESMTVVAVLVAMIVWYYKSDAWGVYMSTNAMLVASIPTYMDAWAKPAEQDVLFWTLSGLGCLLTIFGLPKTRVDRYMPVAGALSNGLIVALGARQFF